MGLKLNTASGGSITLQEANTASNLTLTVPAQDGSLVTANSSGNVGIGTSSPSAQLHITGSDINAQLIVENNDATASSAPDVILYRNSATPAASDRLGNIVFRGNDSAANTHSYATIEAEITSTTNGSESGSLIFNTSVAGTTAERMRLDGSGNLLFNSGYGSAATAYGCRAWVNFNGTGTVAIRASGNVSSITDNGTGNYTVNFTTALPDTNYSLIGTTGDNGQIDIAGYPLVGSPLNTSSATVITRSGTGVSAKIDIPSVQIAIFR